MCEMVGIQYTGSGFRLQHVDRPRHLRSLGAAAFMLDLYPEVSAALPWSVAVEVQEPLVVLFRAFLPEAPGFGHEPP